MGRVCIYPKCTHGRGKVKLMCKMHKLPSSPAKCRIWMRKCRVEGTPRKLPATIYICSCHFVERHIGPTKENPHPLPFQSPAGMKNAVIPKRYPPNVPDSSPSQVHVRSIQVPEKGNSFDADDPTESQGSLPLNITADMQSPGIVSQIAVQNSPYDLKTLLVSLDPHNVVPVIVDQSTMKRKEAEETVPTDSSTKVSKKKKEYNPFTNIGEKLKTVMRASMCADSFESLQGELAENGKSFQSIAESVLAEPLRSFEVEDKDEGGDYQVNRPGEEFDAPALGPRKHRNQFSQSDLPLLSYEMMSESPEWGEKDFKYFTGISKESFEVLYKLLGGHEVCSKLKYYAQRDTPNRSCETTHSPKGHLLITLVRLRRGYPERDMGKFFGVSGAFISIIVTAWIKLMSLKFKSLEEAMFVPVEVQEKNKPGCFKPFPNLRCVVDATEIKIQKPKNFQQQSNTYSQYKGCNTAKFLVACSVYGGLSFISEGFEGNISDRKLILKAGLLDHINPGEAIMVDRGFDIEADLNKREIEIIIPPFLGDRQAFTEREMYIGKAVASSRIHIETLIGRIKNFRLVRYVYPNTMLDILSDVMRVCSVLCNFNDPFVRWEEDEPEDF